MPVLWHFCWLAYDVAGMPKVMTARQQFRQRDDYIAGALAVSTERRQFRQRAGSFDSAPAVSTARRLYCRWAGSFDRAPAVSTARRQFWQRADDIAGTPVASTARRQFRQRVGSFYNTLATSTVCWQFLTAIRRYCKITDIYEHVPLIVSEQEGFRQRRVGSVYLTMTISPSTLTSRELFFLRVVKCHSTPRFHHLKLHR